MTASQAGNYYTVNTAEHHYRKRYLRVGDKNEAAGAADARLCHTQGVWACRDRFIGFR